MLHSSPFLLGNKVSNSAPLPSLIEQCLFLSSQLSQKLKLCQFLQNSICCNTEIDTLKGPGRQSNVHFSLFLWRENSSSVLFQSPGSVSHSKLSPPFPLCQLPKLCMFPQHAVCGRQKLAPRQHTERQGMMDTCSTFSLCSHPLTYPKEVMGKGDL